MLVVLVDMVVVVVIAASFHVIMVAMPAPANFDMVGVAVVVITGLAAMLTIHMRAPASSVIAVVTNLLRYPTNSRGGSEGRRS